MENMLELEFVLEIESRFGSFFPANTLLGPNVVICCALLILPN